MLKAIKKTFGALHRDEQGADMVEYILIVAAIALPLLGVIIWFYGDIKSWVIEQFDAIQDDTEEASSTP